MDIKFDISGDFFKYVDDLASQDLEKVCRSSVNEIKGRTLKYVTDMTPVGRYKKGGKIGGTLKDGWVASSTVYDGDSARAEVYNPVYYAEYVNEGHRIIKNQKQVGYVKGKEMLQHALQQVKVEADVIVKKNLDKIK